MAKKNGGASFGLTFLLLLGVAYGATALILKEPNPVKWYSAVDSTGEVSGDNIKLVVTEQKINGLDLKVTNSSKVCSFKNSTDEKLSYTLSCPSYETYKISNYVSLAIDQENRTINLACNKPFNRQLLLTINAGTDKSAVYLLDYKEAIESVQCDLQVNEGSLIVPNVNVNVSDGTIAVDGTIKNASLSWAFNRDKVYALISTALTNQASDLDDGTITGVASVSINPCMQIRSGSDFLYTYEDLNKADYYLTDRTFSISDMLLNVGVKFTMTSYNGYKSTGFYPIGNLDKSDLDTYFNASTPVFSYSFNVNSIGYSFDFGLDLNSASMDRLENSGVIL